MGGANEICTDKTGTLTKNQMSVRRIYTMDDVYEYNNAVIGSLKAIEYITEGILFNCSARIEKNEKSGKLETKGNCTEQGLINWLLGAGVNAYEKIREKDDFIL